MMRLGIRVKSKVFWCAVPILVAGDASTHHSDDMATKKAKKAERVTLRVTTKLFGAREITLTSEKMAKFYTNLWREEGHKVERV